MDSANYAWKRIIFTIIYYWEKSPSYKYNENFFIITYQQYFLMKKKWWKKIAVKVEELSFVIFILV